MTLNRRSFIGSTAAVAAVLSAPMVKAAGHGKPRVVVRRGELVWRDGAPLVEAGGRPLDLEPPRGARR